MRFSPKLILLAALALCFGVAFVATPRFFNAYYLDILLGIGINIILAVSLNLINGYTGQFSLGHAGFMAVRAYAAASVTLFPGPEVLPLFGRAQNVVGAPALFLLALVAGGVVAAVAGWL